MRRSPTSWRRPLAARHSERTGGCGGLVTERRTAEIIAVSAALFVLCSCEELRRDAPSLFFQGFQRSEIFGFLAGMGTTFAALPDLLSMLKRRSSAGMNPRMAAILCVFQVLWIYYGLLIASRPVIVWNMIAVAINAFTVAAYRYFVRKEQVGKEHGPAPGELGYGIRR